MATIPLFGGTGGVEFIYILTIYYTGVLIVSTILLIITIKKIDLKVNISYMVEF